MKETGFKNTEKEVKNLESEVSKTLTMMEFEM